MPSSKDKEACGVPGCSRPVKCREKCASHYEKWRLEHRGEVAFRSSRWNNPDGTRMTCQSEDCTLPVYAMAMCKAHYHHFQYDITRGKFKSRKNRPRVSSPRQCSFPDCDKPEFNPGLCAGHYYQKLEGREMRPLNERLPCPLPGCGESYTPRRGSRGVCRKHSSEMSRFSLTKATLLALYSNRSCWNPGCSQNENLHLDHDHSCCPDGKFAGSKKSCGQCVRGWLCSSCNISLGMLQENPRRIRGLLDYLDRYAARV